MPGCYGRLAIMSFGDCTSKASSSTNISMESLNEKLKTTIANNNNSSSASIVTLVSQNVVLDNVPPIEMPDIKISQSMRLKIASNQSMQNTLSNQSMDEVANKISQQLDQQLTSTADMGVDSASILEKKANFKSAILTTVKSETTLNAANSALFDAVGIMDQKISLNFAKINDSMTKALVEKYKTGTSAGGRAKLEFSQDFVGEIQADTAIRSVVESITQDEQVNQAEAELIEALAAENKGLANVSAEYIKALNEVLKTGLQEGGQSIRNAADNLQELGSDVAREASDLGSDVAKGVTDVAKAGFDFAKWIPIMIGVVIIAAIIGFVIFGKALVSNPETIKAVGSMTPAGRASSLLGGLTGSKSPAPSVAPSAPSVAPSAPSLPSVPKSAFGFGSCGYRYR
jgi:hypothetical protein